MSREARPTRAPRERVLVCGVRLPGFPSEFEGDGSEARALVRAAGADVVGETLVQNRLRPVAATLLGSGKVEEIREALERHRPDAVLVDNDLTPAQGRNLERAFGVRVIDRSELILDIFARRAKTRQARLQVELAQTEYLSPRLRRMWTHLERTEGAIGTRGPGETQLETDQRLIKKRIRDLRAELREIEARKRREVRTRGDLFTVGLVGYTNAGKSTLLNKLTGSNELVADMPFATLDTRTRQWRLTDGRLVLLSDTVGFLQRLPHHLVASFHATLEETIQADLLLHVIDASHPDAGLQMRAVDEVLATLAGGLRAHVLVFNKVDRLGDPIALHLLAPDAEQDVVYTSAHTGAGRERLEQVVASRMDRRTALVEVRFPASDGRTLARLRATGAVLSEDFDPTGAMCVRSRLTEMGLGSLARGAGHDVHVEVLEPPQEPFLSSRDGNGVPPGWTGPGGE